MSAKPNLEPSTSIITNLRRHPNHLVTEEVMRLLQRSRGRLCEMVRKGRIPAYRDGNGYLFDPNELADWLESRRTVPRRAA
jgi:excisionase family DNA binding protein